MIDADNLLDRLMVAVDLATRTDHARLYSAEGLELVAALAPFPAALSLITNHPDLVARMHGLAALYAGLREGREGSAVAIRRAAIAALKQRGYASEVVDMVALAPLVDGRVCRAAQLCVKSIAPVERLWLAAANIALALRLRAEGDDDAANHAALAETIWEKWRARPDLPEDLAGVFDEITPLAAGLARWHFGQGDVARANALLDVALPRSEPRSPVLQWSPLMEALVEAERWDDACAFSKRTHGYGGELLYNALRRASRAAEAEEIAAVLSQGRRARALAATAPATAGAELDAAVANLSKEVLREQYEEGLCYYGELFSVPLSFALTAFRLGREREARERLADVDRDIREDIRSSRPEPPQRREAGGAPPSRDAWERAKVRREAIDEMRETVRGERFLDHRDRRRILSSVLRLAIALASTEEADLGRALLNEVSAAVAPCWEKGSDHSISDSEQEKLADAFIAYREVRSLGPLLDRNRTARWHPSRSALLARLLREMGRADEAARVLHSAIESVIEPSEDAGNKFGNLWLRRSLRPAVVLIAVEVGELTGFSGWSRIDEAFERADRDLWPIGWLTIEPEGG